MTKEQIKNRIIEFAKSKRKNPSIFLTIAQIESNFDISAVNNSTSASGVFQFLPSTFFELLPNGNLFDLDDQLTAFYYYWYKEIPRMFNCYKIPNNNTNKVIAYNFGIGNLKNKKRLPKETVNYLDKFTKLMISNLWVA